MKVGDYVRTKNGIEKIINIKEWVHFQGYEKIISTDKNEYENICEQSLIEKSSPNIMDLIEEHDFVQMEDRGNRFYEIEKDYTGKLSLRDIGWDEYEELDETNIPEIISIITHEQMEQMKYNLESEVICS